MSKHNKDGVTQEQYEALMKLLKEIRDILAARLG